VGCVSAARREMSTAARSEWRVEGGDDGQKGMNETQRRGPEVLWKLTIVKCSPRKTYFVGKGRWLELWKPCGRKAQAAT